MTKIRRSIFEINYKILDSLNNKPICQNKILARANISLIMFKKLIYNLERRGYIQKEEIIRNKLCHRPTLKPKRYGYVITPIGSRVYLQIKSVINIFN
jgi:predicted transcriptional regulator